MEAFRITTWNVLHRVHAEKDPELCHMTLDRYPKEVKRIADIVTLVEDQFVQGSRVVCLQEVSGELLSALRERLGKRVTIFDHQHQRIPEQPEDTTKQAILKDPTEYLVVLTDFPAAEAVTAHPFTNNKGVLGVRVQSNLCVYNVHASPKRAGEKQIRHELMQLLVLPFLAKNKQNQVVVAGDLGMELERVFGAVGELAFCTGEDLSEYLQEGKHTCQDKDVDHIVGIGGTEIFDAVLYPNSNLSIHQPLQATVGARLNSPARQAAGTRSGFRDYKQDKL
eukprot:TRINITY_DN96670_c0_g1_i1.p1 TRINITY_DN96670_c0_g1~~TRINITY_DN96670_c0_g1_i1.p1  ORF type:complete len:280 (+),score=43.91 TRINITY_DN96670_c0_g1_i1:35-874(+)